MPEPRPFAAVLAEMSRGATLEKLTTELHKVGLAVENTGGRGELNLKITIKANGDGSVTLSDKITTKTPDPYRGDSVFFVTKDKGLQRTDPRQPELPNLREVMGEDK
ncbi:MAG: hypothetical protein OXC11_02210 [Rhodospirillales bacterium]|nr:hypothetical protein [Rhodospirillales bacterium]